MIDFQKPKQRLFHALESIAIRDPVHFRAIP